MEDVGMGHPTGRVLGFLGASLEAKSFVCGVGWGLSRKKVKNGSFSLSGQVRGWGAQMPPCHVPRSMYQGI